MYTKYQALSIFLACIVFPHGQTRLQELCLLLRKSFHVRSARKKGETERAEEGARDVNSVHRRQLQVEGNDKSLSLSLWTVSGSPQPSFLSVPQCYFTHIIATACVSVAGRRLRKINEWLNEWMKASDAFYPPLLSFYFLILFHVLLCFAEPPFPLTPTPGNRTIRRLWKLLSLPPAPLHPPLPPPPPVLYLWQLSGNLSRAREIKEQDSFLKKRECQLSVLAVTLESVQAIKLLSWERKGNKKKGGRVFSQKEQKGGNKKKKVRAAWGCMLGKEAGHP